MSAHGPRAPDLLRADEDRRSRSPRSSADAGLAHVRRREVDGDPARRDGRSPLLRIAPRTRSRASLERGVGEPDDREPGQARGDVDLDPDDPAVEAVERRGQDAWRARADT